MYWSASIETSAACRLSRIRTSGLPPAIRVSVLAMSSKTWIRSSAFFSSDGTAMRESPLTPERSSPISESWGKSAIRSGARSEKSGRSEEAAGVARLEVVLDELAEALVGEGPVLLDEAPVEDADLPDHGEVLELLEQACLADPGLPGHDCELALAGNRGVQAALELRELLLAADENGGGRALDDAAPGENDRHLELVGREARPVALERFGDLARLLGRLPGSFSRQRSTMSWSSSRISAPSPRGGCGTSWTMRYRIDWTSPVKGGSPDEALVENDAQRVDVGAPVEGPRGDLLWREIRDRSDERARLGQPGFGRRVREAEVHDAHADARASLLAGRP